MQTEQRFVENIFVTGIPRSGTSMVAALLARSRVFSGMPKNEDLETSSFEHSVIKKAILRPHLQAIGADPMGYFPLPSEGTAEPTIVPGKLLMILMASGYRGGLWMVKSSRLLLMWKAMQTAFPHSLWVIVRRDVNEVIRSCLATGMTSTTASHDMDWKAWAAFHEKQIATLKASGANVVEVWPNEFFRGEYKGARQVLHAAGCDGWADESVAWLADKLNRRNNGRNANGK